jgi:hypothetical protein
MVRRGWIAFRAPVWLRSTFDNGQLSSFRLRTQHPLLDLTPLEFRCD